MVLGMCEVLGIHLTCFRSRVLPSTTSPTSGKSHEVSESPFFSNVKMQISIPNTSSIMRKRTRLHLMICDKHGVWHMTNSLSQSLWKKRNPFRFKLMFPLTSKYTHVGLRSFFHF